MHTILVMKKTNKKPINFGFWKKVKETADAFKRPILTLAPMADVTDAAFRRIIAKYSRMGKKDGGPDALWTEFVSADGLCSPGREVLLRDLAFSEKERPIVAQLFTSHPEKMREAANLVASLGFDGLDINMGCPDRSIEKQHAGAAMMKDVESAIAVIQATREGVGGIAPNTETFLGPGTILLNRLSNSHREIAAVSPAGHSSRTATHDSAESPPTQAISARSNSVRPSESSVSVASLIPISVKTRIGYNKIEIDTWIRALLEQRLPVLTIHLRTRKEMSDAPAHWELMPEIIKLRNEISPETLIIGNGDVKSLDDAKEKAEKSGCDGIMFGRAIFGNPWLFDRGKVKMQNAKGKSEEQSMKAGTSFGGLLGEPSGRVRGMGNRGIAQRKIVPAGMLGNLELSVTQDSRLRGNDKLIVDRLRVLVEHTELFERLLGDVKNFAVMKKHFKAYANGWDGAKELRMKLMETKDAAEVKIVIGDYLKRTGTR